MSNANSSRGMYARNRAGKPIKLKIGERRRPKRKRIIPQATLRCRDLDLYFDDRYGPVLPDDDAGREDVMIYLHHLAHRQGDRQFLMHEWLDQRAPWLVGSERKAYIAKAFHHAIRYTADVLAAKLGLTYARRQRLGITTIGSTDVLKEAREEQHKAKDRKGHEKKRRAAGCMTREEYEGQSTNRLKPWKAQGISRAAYYRREKQKAHYAVDGLVSPIAHAVVTVSSH